MTTVLNKAKLNNLANEIWKSAERLRGKFKAYERFRTEIQGNRKLRKEIERIKKILSNVKPCHFFFLHSLYAASNRLEQNNVIKSEDIERWCN